MGGITTASYPVDEQTFRRYQRTIWKCRACRHRMAEGPYADTEHYENLGAETTWHREQPHPAVNRIKTLLAPKSSILDVGCNTGDLLTGQFPGHTWFGIEPNREAAKVAQSRGVEILASTLEGLDIDRWRASFDAIFAFDLIEHIQDPLPWLESLKPLIKQGGILVLETGRADAVIPRLEKKRWYYLRFFEHLRAYSVSSIALSLARAGYAPPRIYQHSHSGSRFRNYGPPGLRGLLVNALHLNDLGPERDGLVFFPWRDHMTVVSHPRP